MKRVPAAVFFALLFVVPASAGSLSFSVKIDPAVHDQPYSGRLYIALAPEGQGEPRQAMHAWFDPPPVFALDVTELDPGVWVDFTPPVIAHPIAMTDVPPGIWRVQAIARLNPDSPKPGLGAGDLCSEPMEIEVTANGMTHLDMQLNQVVEEPPFETTERVKLFEMRSPSLSAFLGRSRMIRAAIVLPPDDDIAAMRESETRLPVVVWIGGFGSDHTAATGLLRRGFARGEVGEIVIWVVPDPLCYTGHSTFANSATNGPWGTALVHELLPAIDAVYHTAGPSQRFVTGISSGGWSSLWLQVTYPEHFAGCWSHVPDPIGFDDFLQIDLYAPKANIYRDEQGNRRPTARRDGEAVLMFDEFIVRESVLGPGGQIGSLEAVFGPPTDDGTPRPMFDRKTGMVDPVTIESWTSFDIARTLRENWNELAPRLEGKLHIYAGSEDNFYLEGPVEQLREDMKTISDDPVIEIIDRMGHSIAPTGMRDMFDHLREVIEAGRSAGATSP